MKRYWIIAPVESHPPERYDRVWKYDLEKSVVTIGWQELGDVSRMTKDELSSHIASTYPDKPKAAQSLIANMFWAFYHEMQIGDVILARRGRKRLAGVGEVTRTARFEVGVHPELAGEGYTHENVLGVSWRPAPRDVMFTRVVFPMHTVAETTEVIAEELIGRQDVNSNVRPEDEVLATVVDNIKTFELEKHLEDFIVYNFDAVFGGNLILRDEYENSGRSTKPMSGR